MVMLDVVMIWCGMPYIYSLEKFSCVFSTSPSSTCARNSGTSSQTFLRNLRVVKGKYWWEAFIYLALISRALINASDASWRSLNGTWTMINDREIASLEIWLKCQLLTPLVSSPLIATLMKLGARSSSSMSFSSFTMLGSEKSTKDSNRSCPARGRADSFREVLVLLT